MNIEDATMITLEFVRYVPTPKVKCCEDGSNGNIFTVLTDHIVNKSDSQLPVNRATHIADKWLEDHYGYVVITIFSNEFDREPTVITLNNFDLMQEEFNKMGLKIILNK